MSGNKHDNGVHEIGTSEMKNAYMEDTPGQMVERYIKEAKKKNDDVKQKLHFSQKFDNPLKGFPYNESVEVDEGAFYGRDDLVKQFAPTKAQKKLNVRLVKNDKKGYSRATLNIKKDKKKIAQLKKDGYKVDPTYYTEEYIEEDVMSFLSVALPAYIAVNTVALVGLIASEMAGIDIIGKTEKAIENIKSKFKGNKNYKPSKSELETLKKVGQEIKKKDPSAYKKAQQKVNSMKESFEPLEEDSFDDKSKKSGISVGVLKKVYKRGVAAWKTGHRPGTTPEQWGHARVNAFIVKKKKGNLNHDKDLA
jgi:hypothetical protein